MDNLIESGLRVVDDVLLGMGVRRLTRGVMNCGELGFRVETDYDLGLVLVESEVRVNGVGNVMMDYVVMDFVDELTRGLYLVRRGCDMKTLGRNLSLYGMMN